MKKQLLATTSMAACLLAGGPFATTSLAETELQEVVVSGGGNGTFVNTNVLGGQDLLTLPTTVTVVDRERFNLDTVNYTDSRNELLTRVPGMTDVRNLRVPCGWCDYTVNLQNGLATQDFGGGSFNFDSANNYDIERIEIIKGPASALYPSNAFGGVIDVITKKPPSVPTLSTRGDVGSWGRRSFGADFGMSIGDSEGTGANIGTLGFKASAMIYRLDGWRDGREAEKSSYSGRVVWDPNGDTSFEVGASWTKKYEEDPGTLTAAQWAADWGQSPSITEERTWTTTADAKFAHQFTDVSKFSVSYGYVHEKSESRWSDGLTNRHDLKPRYTHDFDFWNSQLIVGADLGYSDYERIGSSQVDTKIASPYVQYAFSPFAGTAFLENLKFTLGERYEYTEYDYTDAGGNENKIFSKATPHLGATYKLNENNSVWVSYSQGFSAPATSRLWPTSTRTVYADNPNLDPESAENFEIGVRGTLVEDMIAYDVSWHETSIEDFIQSELIGAGTDGIFNTRDDVFQYRNIGEVSIKGLEAQLSINPVKWAGVEVAYTYAINKYVDYVDTGGVDLSGRYMRNSSTHHVNTRLVVRPVEEAKIELEWDHASAYYIDAANTAKYKRPDLLHLSASYKLNNVLTFWGQIRNLSDQKYAERVTDYGRGAQYTAGLPRSFALGLSLKVQF